MLVYELEMKMQLNDGLEERDCHYTSNSFLNLFKKFEKILNEFSSDWSIRVWFWQIKDLHIYKIKNDKIAVENEEDRTALSYFTTTGQAPFDA